MPKPMTKLDRDVESFELEDELPDSLKVYSFHKIQNLRWERTNDDAYADCPFCDRAGKFGISIETTKYQCLVCGAKGNEYTFARSIWDLSLKSTNRKSYKSLVDDSKFLSEKCLLDWQIAKHILTDEWCVPGYNHEHKVTGLYRFVNMKTDEGWKRRLLPSPRLGHHLFGLNLYSEDKPNLAICEGWRDGIILYETMCLSGDSGVPLINDWNVISVPGTNSFKSDWSKFGVGKNVAIMYDNDLPRKNKKTKKNEDGAGLVGVRRVASILKSQPKDQQPKAIMYLAWGDTEQYSDEYKNGLDLRDFLSNA